ncbi:uncharacterized protein PITG_10552 [Phytophthora infestans T30-4]|uniref:Uncharacterized protein n=1 Tax=Phytophthora infestans (strain T30-4) TaxID=403677 RepID=D0NFL0_PHYIT|nr:uncharacterized protein PITG_10552 [Phytophthora infestans T30-4]EEY56999.1 hypothetical protein PITG_10552 [Phytophthora infestans T30-4]|eukprot:XP_002902327.1 hypothetical protein PITG_10552 [Phytophthora infestans T30-4]
MGGKRNKKRLQKMAKKIRTGPLRDDSYEALEVTEPVQTDSDSCGNLGETWPPSMETQISEKHPVFANVGSLSYEVDSMQSWKAMSFRRTEHVQQRSQSQSCFATPIPSPPPSASPQHLSLRNRRHGSPALRRFAARGRSCELLVCSGYPGPQYGRSQSHHRRHGHFQPSARQGHGSCQTQH